MTDSPLPGPLQELHSALGASFAEFGGWSMPVSYAGTVGEHTAVRESVGLFDVSHLGKVRVSGPGAGEYVDSVLTNDLGKIGPGRAQYTLCCTEDGGVVDDLIVYVVSDDDLFLVPNAANAAAVAEILREGAPAGVEVVDEHRDHAVLAVQGPLADDVLEAVGLPTDMEYMAFRDATLTTPDGPVPVRVCRSGYTGERGFELIPAWSDSEVVFTALLEAVRARGGQPAGLGARDTLRTEMGYPLHGHELSTSISPLEARCSWAVGWRKPSFRGRDALLAQKEAGAPRTLVGLKALDKGVLRADAEVLAGDDRVVGTTTSGTFSPTLKLGIALALLDSDSGVSVGDEVTVRVRGRALRATVVRPPFVETHTK